MTPAKVLRTDVHLTPPEGGYPQCFPAGTKASDLPDWVADAKATDALGRPTEEPLLGDHVWLDASDKDDQAAVAGHGETAGYARDATITETVETLHDEPDPEPPPRKSTRR